MTKGRKILYSLTATFVLGAIAGILLAPNEGAETRRKLRKVKRFFKPDDAEADRDALLELKGDLQREIRKINEKLEVGV